MGPVRRFGFSVEHAGWDPAMEDWLQSPAFDNLQQLEFHWWWLFEPIVPLPASIFRFAATLRLASIGSCRLAVQALHFPQLKHLALDRVVVSEFALHSLIASCPALACLLFFCPALACLLLNDVSGFRCARINSPRLKSIGVLAGWVDYGVPHFEELIIENAPCLERLFRIDLFDVLQVSVISAPMMETLCFVDNGHFRFGMTIRDLHADSLGTMVCTVKILDFKMVIFCLEMVVDLMGCFPFLEKLYLQNEARNVSGSGPKNCWRRRHINPNIKCLDTHLKKIVLESYQGIVSEVNFVTFFVLNARVLESMTIQVKSIDEEFIAKQERLLQVENKASRGAKFHFTTEDLTDPFVRRC